MTDIKQAECIAIAVYFSTVAAPILQKRHAVFTHVLRRKKKGMHAREK